MIAECSIRKAALINGISKYSNIFLNIIFAAILSRILSPKDYGIVAVTTVFTTFFGLFSDFGLGAGVVQNQKLTKENIDHIYSFNTFIAICLAGLFCVAAFPIASFYKTPELIKICCLLSLSLFFNTMNSIPNAVLLKRQRFLLIGTRTIIVRFITGFITIILAYLGMKYYALVFQAIISAALIYFWNMVSTDLRFTFKIRKESFSDIIGYSWWQFCDRFINYFSRNTDHFLVGRFLGTASLGFYDKSYRLMLYPIQNFTHVISPVLHPILATHQDDKEYIFNKYMRIVKVLSLAGIYASLICFFCDREAILIVFGNQWSESIPCFKILSLAIWAQMTTSSTGAIFQSLDKTKIMFYATMFSSLIMVILTVIGLSFNTLPALAISVAVALNISFIINYYVLIKYGFNKNFICLMRKLFPDIVTFVIVLFCMSFIKIYVNNLFFSALLKTIIISVIFVIALIISGQKNLIYAIFRKLTYKTISRLRAKKLRQMIIDKPLESSGCEKKIIVSLTSFPARFETLDISIKSLFAQSIRPDRIILYLGTDCDKFEISKRILELEKYGLEIKRGYPDIKPHKKYCFAMQEYPDDIIITVDDDLMYDKNLIRDLIQSYKKNPKCVSARRVHRITAQNGIVNKYMNFEKSYKMELGPSHTLLSTNGAGTLFPPHSLPEEAFNIENIKKLSLTADDIWLKFMLIKNNVPVVWVKSRCAMPFVIPSSQKEALYNINCDENDSNNDRCIKAVGEYYHINLADYIDKK